MTYIKNPFKITDVEAISLVGGKKKETALIIAKDKITEIQNEIGDKTDQINKLTKLIERLKSHNPVKGRRKAEE